MLGLMRYMISFTAEKLTKIKSQKFSQDVIISSLTRHFTQVKKYIFSCFQEIENR